MMANTVEIRGADQINALLKALPRAVTANKNGGICAKAMRKGGNVIRKEARIQVQKAIDVGADYATGELKKKITVRRVKYVGKGENFHVTVGRGYHKTRKDGSARSQAKKKGGISIYGAGAILEYGSSKQQATPWMRLTFAKTHLLVFTVINNELLSSLDKLAKIHLPQER